MTDNQKEAIERLNNFKTIKVLYGNTFAMHLEQLKQLQNDIKTALNLIQTQQAEIEKKDKIIDEMVTYIATLDIEEDICEKTKNEHCDKMSFGECEDCIKQYFERKVENGN